MGELSLAARNVSGISLYLQPVQDLTVDSTVSRAQYQMVLESATTPPLDAWVPRLISALSTSPGLANVSTNYLDKGLSADIVVDRDTAARFGITAATIDTLSTMHSASESSRRSLPNPTNTASSWKRARTFSARLNPFRPSTCHLRREDRCRSTRSQKSCNNPCRSSAIISASFCSPDFFRHGPGPFAGRGGRRDHRCRTVIHMPGSITTTFQGAALAFRNSLGSELLLISPDRHGLHRAWRAL